MKRLLTFILLLLVSGLVRADPPTGIGSDKTHPDLRVSSVQEAIYGEHSPMIFTGEDTLSATGSRFPYTRWMQVGWVSDGDRRSNEYVQKHNPEIFRVGLKLACQHAGSDADVDFGKIQYAVTAADTVTSVILTVGETDTTDVGETITGTESFASAVVTARVSSTSNAGADSQLTANYLPGPLFTTADTVGGALYEGTGSIVSAAANYFGGVGENADSSHWFCYSGAASLEMYPEYMAEPVSDTSMYWWFPVRAIIGGYMRIYLETSQTDTGLVDWTLICEH